MGVMPNSTGAQMTKHTLATSFLKRPSKQDIIIAAADVFDYDMAGAEADLVASDWFIGPRIAGWLRNHGFSI